MPSLLDIGKRAGMALGASIFTAAGQTLYSTASGVADVLAAPTIANQPLVASSGLLPSWGSPSGAVAVAADVAHAQSSSTLTDVTGLAVPIGASVTEIWFFEAYLVITATSTAADMKLGWTYPTSATMRWGQIGAIAAAAGWTGIAGNPTAIAVQTDTATFGTGSNTMGLGIAGYITGGGTAGNVQLQFAQNTPTASDLSVLKGSMLRYRRLIA